MATKNMKNTFAKSSKATKAAKATAPKAAEKFERLMNVIGFLMILVPAIFALVKLFKKESARAGIRTGKNLWTTALEVDGFKVEGEEVMQCAVEGLSARVAKAKAAEEAELDRRVANAMKKAQQGQNRV